MGNLNEENETDRRLCDVASQKQAAMKGTIRRKRRPPVVHAGLPLIPDRRDKTCLRDAGHISLGNSGYRKHRSS
ncbi:hypothetical protein G6M78_11660 [Agrobacterium tumefaciens]|uniref:Uncharacterized protein n=2 Tax=Rhizobium/Agrobacterium group TaxID=227290 RepID=A0A546XH29_AGRTU|nr:hypothetical protein [Agrobacterium tumefaciens]NTE55725.1 hypothetical protein [Agrobacterium tumefaciens]NTE71477.1 hypothetical protein [Agrobacterium tumefaciens]TRB00053.1 hypothetical protein EXN61_25950 [Agrobacterium tumefaciens]TRB03161.1 hypothetical protein EXN68_04595 [Rhizobium rhizogenes]